MGENVDEQENQPWDEILNQQMVEESRQPTSAGIPTIYGGGEVPHVSVLHHTGTRASIHVSTSPDTGKSANVAGR